MEQSITRKPRGLLECPDETLLSILLFCSRADLLALSRVNKQFNHLTSPSIYANVHFNWTSAVKPPVTTFLHTILSKPHIAGYVEQLTLSSDGSFFSEPNDYRAACPKVSWAGEEPALHMATSLVAGLDLSYSETWIQELRNGAMDSVVAFILVRLPNLRSLSLEDHFTKEIERLGAVLYSSLCGREVNGWLSRFEKLRQVSMGFQTAYHSRRDANTPKLLPLFYLPSVQQLDLILDNPVSFSWPAAPPVLENLVSLKLSHVREEGLKFILSTTRSLESLDWEFIHSRNPTTTQETVTNPALADLDLIVDALMPVRNTLVDLTLRAQVIDDGMRNSIVQIRGSLSGLVGFEKVKRFQAPLPFLAGKLIPDNIFRISERIPRNIQTLVISDDLGIYTDEPELIDEDVWWETLPLYINLRSWFYKWRSMTPHFRNLELMYVGSGGDTDEDWRPALQQLCDEKSVQVSLVMHGKPEGMPIDPSIIPSYTEDMDEYN